MSRPKLITLEEAGGPDNLHYHLFIQDPVLDKTMIGHIVPYEDGGGIAHLRWAFHQGPAQSNLPLLSDVIWELGARLAQNDPTDESGPFLSLENPYQATVF